MLYGDPSMIYTERQLKSSFLPPQIPILPPPINMDANVLPAASQQQESVPTTNASQKPLRFGAEPFVPSTNFTSPRSSSLIYDLNKYKYDYFLSNLSCSFDPENAKFGSPTGICTLNDDRLLVANFDRDSLFILDIKGTVYEIYRQLLSPKDVLYFSSNPSQALVATRRDLVLLDLETKQIVTRSKSRGLLPWNVQYIKEYDTFAACDASGERIVYFDRNLNEVGTWSFHDQIPGQYSYQKKYPYAAHFFPDNTSLVLTHVEDRCHLMEYDTVSRAQRKYFPTPPGLKAYSMYVDDARKCLIADKTNRRLVSINPDATAEEYRWPSIREPYSMTFLSNGTLCVTDWSKSAGAIGGIAVLSEFDLNTNASN